MVDSLIFMLALLVALAADHWLGEPPVRWHPVVWMGNYLAWMGAQLQQRTRQTEGPPDFKAFGLGAAVWLGGVAIVLIVALFLQYALLALPGWLGPVPGGVVAGVVLGLCLKPLLAWAMLKSEVLAVERALNPAHGGSLAAGRERLSWLVSRDVTQLTETQVRESAIETLAENLNDSVIAPIFWFVLLGLPGAALYRFANTADAMWGYRGLYNGHNWLWAGKWAARADDVLSWVPARLTAALLALVSGRVPLKRLRAEAGQTPSPNSGWPMAAMALALDVRLSKPGVYALNPAGRAPQPLDLQQSPIYASKVILGAVFIGLLAMFYVAFFDSLVGPIA